MSTLSRILNQPIDIEDYLIWSTAAIPLMFLILGHAGADILLGYLFILLNSLILLIFNRLKIHRNHILAIAAVGAFSLVGSSLAGTPINAILSQLVGISILSVYFLSALSVLGPSIARWMDMYSKIALGVALVGIFLWAVERQLGIGDGRLKSFYAEPSNFVYATLPALGYFVNCYVQARRYGIEAIIFIVSYILSDAALGFLGLILVATLAFSHRMKPWHALLGVILVTGFLAGLYFSSANFRVRVRDTAIALATQDVSKSNGSTYAFLSNAYVAGKAFADNPITGVGIGGYSYIYDKYISDLTGISTTDADNLNLNRADANSLIFRVAAELGAPGVFALLAFIIACGKVEGTAHRRIRNAIIPYLIVRMARFGAYFSVELYFFVGIYVLNYVDSRNGTNLTQPQLR